MAYGFSKLERAAEMISISRPFRVPESNPLRIAFAILLTGLYFFRRPTISNNLVNSKRERANVRYGIGSLLAGC